MTNIPNLIKINADRWRTMKLDPARQAHFTARAKVLTAPENKARFYAVTKRLIELGYQPVPWFVIAIIAEREYGGPQPNGKGWDKQLGQGDPLNQVSQNDPAGRGPFITHPGDDETNNAWLRCALDALIDCGPHAALWNDWTIGGLLTILEEYNGLGYAARGVPSAYVWSGTDVYVSGKYVADHVYRADVKDVQDGCAPLLKAMMLADPTIQPAGAPAPVIVAPKPAVVVPPNLHPQVPPVKVPEGTKPAPQVVPGGLVQELLDAWHRL